MTNIQLDAGVKGYEIIRKKCPNCDAEFIFKLHDKEVHDVAGEGYNYPDEKVVRCKICMSTFKYTVDESIPHVGFGK